MKVRTRRGMSILVCILVIGQAVLAASEAELLYGQAQELERQGRRSDAVSLYRQIVQEYPDSPEAGPDHAGYRVHRHALCEAIDQDDTKTVLAVAETIKQLPSSAEKKPAQLYDVGLKLEKMGLHDEALSFYHQLVTYYPNASEAGNGEGGYRVHHINLVKAMNTRDAAAMQSTVEVIRQLVLSPEEKSEQLYEVGKLLEQRGFYEEAGSLYQQVITEFPGLRHAGSEKAAYRIHLAAIQLANKTNDTMAARSAAETIRRQAVPPHEKVVQLYETGEILEKSGFYEEAISFYQQVNAEYPDSRWARPSNAGFQLRRSMLKLAIENEDAASVGTIAEMIRSMDLSATRHAPEKLYATGELLEHSGWKKEALAFYQQVLAEYPDSPAAGPEQAGFRAAYLTVKSMADNGDIAGIQNMAGVLAGHIQTPLNSGRADAFWRMALAKCYIHLQEDEQVYTVVKSILSDYPDMGGVGYFIYWIGEEYYLLAEKYFKANQREQGRIAFKAAIQIWDNNKLLSGCQSAAMAAYYSGIVSGYLGDDVSALEYFQEVVQTYPEYERAWHASFMMAECAEKLSSSGVLKSEDATALQLAAYQRILQNNPDSPVSQIVRHRLQTLSR